MSESSVRVEHVPGLVLAFLCGNIPPVVRVAPDPLVILNAIRVPVKSQQRRHEVLRGNRAPPVRLHHYGLPECCFDIVSAWHIASTHINYYCMHTQ